jgi:peptide deformylase
MPLKIAQLGQPILRRVADEVAPAELASEDFQRFLRDMEETMIASGGVGLAAPQVFVGKRVFLARILPPSEPSEEPGTLAFINPRIIAASQETAAAWEGCLSFSELQVLVPRARRVIVEFLDAAGQPRRLDAADFPARVIQHENDHLDGILTLDRAPSTRDIVKASEMDAVLAELHENKEVTSVTSSEQ